MVKLFPQASSKCQDKDWNSSLLNYSLATLLVGLAYEQLSISSL